ncbi:MAG TPA: hypothetical protein VF706_00775 [Solirubrobacteraceae bacterium]
MPDDALDVQQLTVSRTAPNYWVVRSGASELSGAVTRQAAEAERDLVRRLRRRTAQMRSSAPHRPRAVQRPPR